jgi:hypothetical protein
MGGVTMTPGRTQILKATADIAKLCTDTTDVERRCSTPSYSHGWQEGKRLRVKAWMAENIGTRQRCKKNLNVKVKQHTVLLTH